jgi:hypothetical protein
MTLSAFHHKVQKLEDFFVLRREADLRHEVYQKLRSERELGELAETCRITDPQLLSRISNSGFDNDTVPALWISPLALIAWASGSVSIQEREAAMQAVAELPWMTNAAVTQKFNSWLETPPPSELMKLWSDCVAERLRTGSAIEELPSCQFLLAAGNQIALASGGILGLGKICKAEYAILEQIQSAYSGSPDSV